MRPGLHTVLCTMQSPPPAGFLTNHMVFVKLWEVKEPCDGAVEDLVVKCLPPRYRNKWTSRYYIDWGAMSTPSNICLFLDCVMERLGGRCFRIVLVIITHVFTISVMHCFGVVWTQSLGSGLEFWSPEYGWTGLQRAGCCADSTFASGIWQ